VIVFDEILGGTFADERDSPPKAMTAAVTHGTDKFSVGGYAMDGPHDPAGPPAETISCRCTLTYDIPDDELVVPDEPALTGTDAWASLPHQRLEGEAEGVIEDYRMSEYFPINQHLRHGADLAKVFENYIQVMDDTIGASVVPQKIEVLRGMRSIEKKLDGAKVGDIITDKGFSSTTTSPRTAASFVKQEFDPDSVGTFEQADRPAGAIMHINMPAGSKGLPVPDSSEQELLLPRNSKYRIDKIDQNPDLWDVYVTVVT